MLKSEKGASRQTFKMIGCHRDFSERLFVQFVAEDTVTALAVTVSFSTAPEKEQPFPGALRHPFMHINNFDFWWPKS
jgi:hypothetical protein